MTPAKGLTALPNGIVTALASNRTLRIQLVTSDGICVDATMNEVTKNDGVRYQG